MARTIEFVSTAAVQGVSVVIPTIGREALLRRCLGSLAACDPLPAEVLVIDQSGGDRVAAMPADFPALPLRVIRCERRGIATGVNLGLREAVHATVLVTHDDCTVAADWVGVGAHEMAAVPGGVISGMVLPVGDPLDVPSTKVDEEPHDYTGQLVINALYGNNVGLPRQEVLALGGFDERDGFRLASEDNDLCYRWLKAGRTLRYVPTWKVHHHDWRSPDQLVAHYRTYIRSDGVLYAKYLLRRDWRILPFMLRELSWGVRGLAGGLLRGRPAWQDPRRAILRNLPAGLVIGAQEELRLRRTEGTAAR